MSAESEGLEESINDLRDREAHLKNQVREARRVARDLWKSGGPNLQDYVRLAWADFPEWLEDD